MPNFVKSISIEFHTHDDDLDDNTLLHLFVRNRSSDTSWPAHPTDFIGNYLSYQNHEAEWYGKNPYLGFRLNASAGNSFNDPSTHKVDIQLRSRPIPLDEIELPVVDIHILPKGDDRWIFDYTITFTLDNGVALPAWHSNVDGITGIILDQDDRNYSGICQEFNAIPPRTKPQTDAVLTAATIEFHTHNDDKNADTQLNIHIVNRLNATTNQDISVASNIAKGESFPDSDTAYKRLDLPLASNSINLRDMVLPVVYINIGAGQDRWNFDYRVTLVFGDEEPYSWTTYGVVLDQDNHKHMGVYSGREITPLAYPQAALESHLIRRDKNISLTFVQKKLQELINDRQVSGAKDPFFKLTLDSTVTYNNPIPTTYADLQSIKNGPPPPGIPPTDARYKMTMKYPHNAVWSKRFAYAFSWIGVVFKGIDCRSLSLNVAENDNETPVTALIDFDTSGGASVIEGAIGSATLDSMQLKQFTITVRLTLRYDVPSKTVDLFGWIDDLASVKFTPTGVAGVQRISGNFLGVQLSGDTLNPAKSIEDLKDKVVDVVFTTSSAFDVGGMIQKRIRDQVFSQLTSPDPITKVTPRQAINAALNSWLMGGVVASGNTQLVPYPNPCELTSATVNNNVLSLSYIGPAKSFVYHAPPDWPQALEPGNLANIDHIIVVTQENRSFDHMLGYLSLPYEKGGMNRQDVDGLKGGEFNMLGSQRCESVRLAPGDTIFSPGPAISSEAVAIAINNGKMDGFAEAEAYESGPAGADRVMAYHTADNVPTYDALARDFAIGHRWFAAHPGCTFPNRFYELTGRPNIDPWGAWEYKNSSPVLPVFTDTVLDHLSERGISWKYFEHKYGSLRFFERHTFDSENVVAYDDPINGFNVLAKSGNLPSVSFVDPHFLDYPPGSFCDEPPSDIKLSQPYLRDLVETLVSSPSWEKTLLLITYDEHGGFYDHVPPVPAAKVSEELMGTTGVRVPAFVISPWVAAGSVFGSDSLHFDHASIPKTIIRRFMGTHPPYMGARVAAAHDLAEVLGTALRRDQFLPFIPYRLVYGRSQKRLDVQGAGTAPGTPVWQYNPNETDAQRFSFEDAGDGHVHIRSHTGNLYLTATSTAGVVEAVKYTTGSTATTDNPDRQRWFFQSTAITAAARDVFTISNAAFPGMVLQPAGDSTNSGVAVVLAAPTGHIGPHPRNPWQVTSPVLPDTTPVVHP